MGVPFGPNVSVELDEGDPNMQPWPSKAETRRLLGRTWKPIDPGPAELWNDDQRILSYRRLRLVTGSSFMIDDTLADGQEILAEKFKAFQGVLLQNRYPRNPASTHRAIGNACRTLVEGMAKVSGI